MATACPLCDSTDARVNWTCTAGEAAQQWASGEQEPARHAELTAIIADLWGQDRVASRQCNACDFGFADPFVAGDHRFYTAAFGAAGYPEDKWEFRRTVQALRAYDCSDWQVLDIGAGEGFFLEKLGPLGITPDRCHGTEYNDVTIERMRRRGYDIQPYDIGELQKFGTPFDAVFMFQVLEHRDRIDSVFHAIHAALKERGKLFIAVPNAARIYFNEANGSLLDMPPNHISRWSPAHFAAAAKRYGFRVIDNEIQPFEQAKFVKQDLIFSFMRRAQKAGTVANYLYPKRKNPLGRAAVAAAVGVNALARVPVWLAKQRELRSLGENVWVQLEKA